MNSATPVAVTSRSFSTHPILRRELLERYSNVTFNDSGTLLKGASLVEFLKNKEKVIIGLDVFDDALLSQLPKLKVISKFGVGLDMLDLESMERRGILLGTTPGVNKRSVSELVLLLTLALLRKIIAINKDVVSGVWKQPKGNCLTGKTVGIVGIGHVGKDLVELLEPFGVTFLCYDTVIDRAFCDKHRVKSVTLDELLRQSDVVTLHLPGNETTRHIVDISKLRLMKESSILINTARGGLVDTDALKKQLKEGKLAGAAFDVFEVEPPVDKELLGLPNFIATSHIGGSTEEAIVSMGRAAIDGLDNAVSAGKFKRA